MKSIKFVKRIGFYFSTIMFLFVYSTPVAFAQGGFFKSLQTPFYDPDYAVCGSTVLSGSDNPEKVWNFFKGKGLSDQQVAGIMGNIRQESSFNPIIMQKGGESRNPADADNLGWGLIQWTPGSKATTLAKQAGVPGPIYELAAQLDLVWHHMNNDPVVTQPFSLSDFQNIDDERQAAEYFRAHIEGGANPEIRQDFATELLKKYRGTASGRSGSSCGNGACKVVYDGQYSQEQLARIFGNPGTAGSHPDLNLVIVDFLGHSAQVSPLVATCLKAVSDQLEAANTKYEIRQFGCYRFDSDNGSSNIGLRSYHSYGAACDINWDTNPWSGDGSAKPYDMPTQFIQAFKQNGFTWGGNWHSVKDYMHFEWHGVVP